MNNAPNFLLLDKRKDGIFMSTPIVEVHYKKENIFKRIKRWWKEDLTDDERTWFKILGIWTVDGALIGASVASSVKDKQMRKNVNIAANAGYIQGKMDAYKEIVQNPYTFTQTAFSMAKKDGKDVKTFNF